MLACPANSLKIVFLKKKDSIMVEDSNTNLKNYFGGRRNKIHLVREKTSIEKSLFHYGVSFSYFQSKL